MEDTIKVEDLSGVEKKISIDVTPTTVDQKFNEFFDNIKKSAEIPGWRKGKAPINIIKRHFKERARGVVAQVLISEFYQTALKDHNIDVIGTPVIKDSSKNDPHLGKFNKDSSYSVQLTVEVMPVVDPIGYDSIEFNITEHNIKDLSDFRMKQYQEQFAERIQVTDAGAELNDTLIVDFKGFINGAPFEGGEASNFTIDKLGAGSLIPGFEEQLVGLKQGDSKKLKITFPEDYVAKHLANKDAEFDTTVHSIVRKNLAKADDDLAMMIGHENLGDLIKYIDQEVRNEANNSDKTRLEGIILNSLIEKNDFEIPKSLVNQEISRMLKHNNIDNPSREIFGKIQESSINNIKKSILFDSIYNKEDIDVTPEELSNYLEEQAKIHNKDKDEIVSMLYNTNQMDTFVGVLRYRKVLDFIIGINKKKGEEDNG